MSVQQAALGIPEWLWQTSSGSRRRRAPSARELTDEQERELSLTRDKICQVWCPPPYGSGWISNYAKGLPAKGGIVHVDARERSPYFSPHLWIPEKDRAVYPQQWQATQSLWRGHLCGLCGLHAIWRPTLIHTVLMDIDIAYPDEWQWDDAEYVIGPWEAACQGLEDDLGLAFHRYFMQTGGSGFWIAIPLEQPVKLDQAQSLALAIADRLASPDAHLDENKITGLIRSPAAGTYPVLRYTLDRGNLRGSSACRLPLGCHQITGNPAVLVNPQTFSPEPQQLLAIQQMDCNPVSLITHAFELRQHKHPQWLLCGRGVPAGSIAEESDHLTCYGKDKSGQIQTLEPSTAESQRPLREKEDSRLTTNGAKSPQRIVKLSTLKQMVAQENAGISPVSETLEEYLDVLGVPQQIPDGTTHHTLVGLGILLKLYRFQLSKYGQVDPDEIVRALQPRLAGSNKIVDLRHWIKHRPTDDELRASPPHWPLQLRALFLRVDELGLGTTEANVLKYICYKWLLSRRKYGGATVTNREIAISLHADGDSPDGSELPGAKDQVKRAIRALRSAGIIIQRRRGYSGAYSIYGLSETIIAGIAPLHADQADETAA